MPIKRLVKILINAVVDPTAASAWLPLNRPTTMISTALNISCRILESINGSEKEINLSIIVRCTCQSHIYSFSKQIPPSRQIPNNQIFAVNILLLSPFCVKMANGKWDVHQPKKLYVKKHNKISYVVILIYLLYPFYDQEFRIFINSSPVMVSL